MGPFKDINCFSHHRHCSSKQEWAHSMLSANCLMSKNWPIQSDQQLFSWVRMGPFEAISTFLHERAWAHSKLSTNVPQSMNRPIRGYRQFVPIEAIVKWARMAHSMSSATFPEPAHSKWFAIFLMRKDGPIQGYRQLFSWVRMSPFEAVGEQSRRHLWMGLLLHKMITVDNFEWAQSCL